METHPNFQNYDEDRQALVRVAIESLHFSSLHQCVAQYTAIQDSL